MPTGLPSVLKRNVLDVGQTTKNIAEDKHQKMAECLVPQNDDIEVKTERDTTH